jgi:uncharacterized membrane protein YidH (DUF202 family)
MTTVHPVRDPDEREVRLNEREALANVRTVLELCATGELRRNQAWPLIVERVNAERHRG